MSNSPRRKILVVTEEPDLSFLLNITKAFSPKELVLRTKSVLRRTKWPVEEWLSAQVKPASLGRN
jgi:hypothetical protein